MKRSVWACLVVVSVLAGCASDVDRTANTSSEGEVVEERSADQREGDLLLVGSGQGFATLAVLDPDSGELEPVVAPSDIGDATPIRAVVGPGADHVLVTTADAMYLWDRRMDATTSVGHGSRILGAAPAGNPAAVLVETDEALRLVDLHRGAAHDLPAATGAGLVPRVALDAARSTAIVANPSGGATAIDLGSGSIAHHDPELVFYQHGLAADGSTVLAGRRTDHGFAVEAIPVFDPTVSATWFAPERPDAQVTVAWVGDQVLAVDLSGRVMTITGGVETELAQLEPGEVDGTIVAATVIHTETTAASSPVALIERRGFGPSRWFRVDVATEIVDELPDIEGHAIVSSALSGHLVVGVGTVGEGFSTLRLVGLADGSVTELLSDPAAPLVGVLTVSDSIVGLTRFDGGATQTELVDMNGALRGVITGRLGFTANTDASRAALFVPDTATGIENSVTQIITMDGSATDLVFEGLYPLAWLPAA